jgi:hypothetical protein
MPGCRPSKAEFQKHSRMINFASRCCSTGSMMNSHIVSNESVIPSENIAWSAGWNIHAARL